MSDKSLGQIGYDAYGEDAKWLTYDNKPMPRWTAAEVEKVKKETGKDCIILTDVIKQRWEIAAVAIAKEITKKK